MTPQRDNKKQGGTARLTRLALLTAIALTIFMAEAQLPTLVPIQGVKLGLANIVTPSSLWDRGTPCSSFCPGCFWGRCSPAR